MQSESATLDWSVQGMAVDPSGAGLITLVRTATTASGAKYICESRQVTFDAATVTSLLDSVPASGQTIRQAIHSAIFSVVTV